MRAMLLTGLLALGAVGCVCADQPGALDYFPISAEGYWVLEGDEGGQPIRLGLRGAGVAEDGAPKLDLAMQSGTGEALQGQVQHMTARRRDGFLELVRDQVVVRLLPEDPTRVDTWEWDNGGDLWRARIVRRDGFRVVPAGRFADVLEVEVGPARPGAERWRWEFVVGVGPIAVRVIQPGVAGAAIVELASHEPGTRAAVPRVAPSPPAPELTPEPAENG